MELFQRDPGANNIDGVHLRHHTNKYYVFVYNAFVRFAYVCPSLFIYLSVFCGTFQMRTLNKCPEHLTRDHRSRILNDDEMFFRLQ